MNSVVRFVKRYPWSLVVVAAILFLSFFKPPQQDFVPVTNLDKIAPAGAILVAAWPRIEGASGMPVRVYAITPKQA